jgi:uncharacterized RDD family membrane protein YckC
MRKILEILTPENVYIEYELAGLGSRFIAYLIDIIIQVVFVGLAVIVLLFAGTEFIAYLFLELGIMVVAFFVTIVLLLNLIYFIFFEMILKGQSPGKKIMKLRVIKQNGEPINLLDSFLRNLLRLFDMLPSYYLVGALFAALSNRCKRIGDFAANTVVVKIKNQEQIITIDNLINQSSNFSEEKEQAVNNFPVSASEYSVLKEFMARKDILGEKRPLFTYNLNMYFLKKFNIDKPYENPYDFFESIMMMNSGL